MTRWPHADDPIGQPWLTDCTDRKEKNESRSHAAPGFRRREPGDLDLQGHALLVPSIRLRLP